jgi:hypothetical protein
MGDVVRPDFNTTLGLSPEVVLDAAQEKLSEVVVLGWEKSTDGNGSFYFAASDADMSRALMLLLRAQKEIMDRTG